MGYDIAVRKKMQAISKMPEKLRGGRGNNVKRERSSGRRQREKEIVISIRTYEGGKKTKLRGKEFSSKS